MEEANRLPLRSIICYSSHIHYVEKNTNKKQTKNQLK